MAPKNPSNGKGKAGASKNLFTGQFKKTNSANRGTTFTISRATFEVRHFPIPRPVTSQLTLTAGVGRMTQLIMARYQKGDKVNELTGNVYMRAKPRAHAHPNARLASSACNSHQCSPSTARACTLHCLAGFGRNEAFKTALAALLLGEPLKWLSLIHI